MIAKIEKEFLFNSAIHFEDKFLINLFEITFIMSVETENAKEQNIAIERLNYFIASYIDNSIFVNEKDKASIEKYENAGLRVLTLPEDPYDQIIGLILIMKCNAIMEGRVVITDIIFHSKLTSGIKFHSSIEETEDFKSNNWWNDPTTATKLTKNKKPKDKDKVIKLFDKDEWSEVGLLWKSKQA
jgi:hypothetical protein